jgi:recombination protein RecA
MAEKKTKITTWDEFGKKWGKNLLDKAHRAGTMGFWTTGSRTLDALIGGGFPQSEIVELVGQSGSGKSSCALSACGNILKAGGRVAWFDWERGLDFSSEKNFVILSNGEWVPNKELLQQNDIERRHGWLRKNNIDPFHENFHVCLAADGEQMFEMIGDMLKASLFDMIVIDSVAAILTRAQFEGDPGDAGFGQVAKLLSIELARVQRFYDLHPGTKTTIVLINQIRDKIGYMSNGGTKSFGGKALEHYPGTKLKFSRVKRTRTSDDEVITETRVQVEKSRHAAALECRIFISSERGLDTLAELIEVGKQAGLIHVRGNIHVIFDKPISAELFEATKKYASLPGFIDKVNGESATLRWLQDHGWEERLTSLPASKQTELD